MATIPTPVLRHVRKVVTFTGGAGAGANQEEIPVFTTTGWVHPIALFAHPTVDVTATGLGTLQLGTTANHGLYPAADSEENEGPTALDVGGGWVKAGGTTYDGSDYNLVAIEGENSPRSFLGANVVMYPSGTLAVTGGSVEVNCLYYPITNDGALTGDDASEAYLPADVQRWLGTTAQGASGRPQVDVELIEGADPSDTIRDAIVDDATRIDASQLNTHTAITAAGIADAVWDEAAAGHTDAGKAGEQLWTDVDAIKADTEDIQSRLPAVLVGGRIDATVDATGMESGAIDAILTRAMTESYNADGAAPTLAQALFAILQRLTEFSISGTTITVKKLDGSTTAFTLTLDDAGSPTSSTRAT